MACLVPVTYHLGSSPLARGLPEAQDERVPGRGIIPARAGFTPRGHSEISPHQDHPRSRGVYHLASALTGAEVGSSPLARGLPAPARHPPSRPRIIPARAGFTSSLWSILAKGEDHPRSRGVYLWTRISAVWEGRIIPARAGFTPRSSKPQSAQPDHPRSRGVYRMLSLKSARSSGSSPLARGLRVVGVHSHEEIRIIPARAGFTRRRPGAGRRGPDHPRSRGVYDNNHTITLAEDGSSPLARGLQYLPGRGELCVGIIPARAGFTCHSRWCD